MNVVGAVEITEKKIQGEEREEGKSERKRGGTNETKSYAQPVLFAFTGLNSN